MQLQPIFPGEGEGTNAPNMKGCFFLLQILQDMFMKLNQIQESHAFKVQSRQERMMFLVPLPSGTVIKLIKIKEAHNIKAQGRFDTMMFF